ncbi:MAG: DUF983 domain-containing protein [Bacteroidetes bacterium]|nr:MAG: DUF983 domain-containing protein [Bacteroidota bacterium]
MSKEQKSRSYISSVVGCRCPRCREGKLFQLPLNLKLKNVLKMNKECPICGQPTDIEVGFYYGTSFVSYGITVFLSVVSFIVWFLTIGISAYDNRFVYWLIFNAVFLLCLQPWLMRFSRSLWISWFVKYDRDWKINKIDETSLERIVKEEMGNW